MKIEIKLNNPKSCKGCINRMLTRCKLGYQVEFETYNRPPKCINKHGE